MKRGAGLLIAAGLCGLLSAGCGKNGSSSPNGGGRAPATRPAVEVGPAERSPEPPQAEGVLAYYGAVVRGYVRARERLKEAELRDCFNTGLALRFGEAPTSAADVRQMLEDGGYRFDRLPAGYGVTYDPQARKVFLLKRDEVIGGD